MPHQDVLMFVAASEFFRRCFRQSDRPESDSGRCATVEPLLAELEHRVLYSASPLASLPTEVPVDNLEFDGELISNASLGDSNVEADSFLDAILPNSPALDTNQPNDTGNPSQIVFVDQGIEGFDSLVSDIRSSDDYLSGLTHLSIIDSSSDGVYQISDILSNFRDVASVHIVSHGSPGSVSLGNVELGAERFDNYSIEISKWNDALAADADVLFYGCDLASNASGRYLIDSISSLCDCDVAASSDLTGSAALGGDWDLEYQTGAIESTVAFSTTLIQEWQGLLATITVDTFADLNDGGDTSSIANLIADPGTDGISLREAILAANADSGQADTIRLPSGTYELALTGDDEDQGQTGDLDILDDLTLIGVDAATTIVDAMGIDRVFDVLQDDIVVSMSNLTIQGGDYDGHGGGIHVKSNNGTLRLDHVVVRDNQARDGGGIFNHDTVVLTDVVLENNIATDEGGGLTNRNAATLNRVTVSGNQAQDGGGLHNDNSADSMTLTNVTVSGNTATRNGGGLFSQEDAIITNSTFTLNSADHGGGIRNTDTLSIRKHDCWKQHFGRWARYRRQRFR